MLCCTDMPPQGETHLATPTLVDDQIRKTYAGLTGAASIAELWLGLLSGNIALAIDGSHGSAEIVIGNEQMKDASRSETVEVPRRRRIYSALFTTSLLGTAVASGEIMQYWDPGIHDPRIDALGAVASGLAFASAAIASSKIITRTRQKYRRIGNGRGGINPDINPADTDVINHIVRLDLPSSGLACGATALGLLAHAVGTRSGVGLALEDAQNIIGGGMGLWGMWLFRPTKHNLEHNHNHG